MRIAFVSCLYPPEPEPSSVMAGQLAKAWAEQGHEVLIICPFPNRPGGKIYPGFNRSLWSTSREAGVSKIRLWSWFIGPARHPWNRLLENLSFGLSAAMALLIIDKPDAILLENWPIAAEWLCALVCRLRRVRWFNYIKDIYPEALVAAGLIRQRSRIHQLLFWLDRTLCQTSTMNIVISEGMRRYMQASRAISDSQITVINDWIDLDELKPYTGTSGWRQEVGFEKDDFVCMFAGTLGHASRASVLVEAATELRDELGIRLVCIGEGVLKPNMRAAAERLQLNNILFLPFQPRERVPEVQSSSDVLLLTTSAEMSVSSVPSKFITYLAIGRPVICAVDPESDIASIVKENHLGRIVRPESAEDLCRAILELRATGSDQLAEMGRNARRVAEAQFSMAAAVDKFRRLL